MQIFITEYLDDMHLIGLSQCCIELRNQTIVSLNQYVQQSSCSLPLWRLLG